MCPNSKRTYVMRRMNRNNTNDDSYDKLNKAYGSISDENQQIRRMIIDRGENSGKTAATGIESQQIKRKSINNNLSLKVSTRITTTAARRCKAEWHRNNTFADDSTGEAEIQKINSEVKKDDKAQTVGSGVCPTTGN
uniref:Uncharacterized protein n=1 Tax=Brugia timori TaxID=42155 RepID=A0A0R3QDN4_9BILA